MGTYAHITRYTTYIITAVVCRGQQASGHRPPTSSVHPLAVVSLVLGPTCRLELWQGRRGTSDSGRAHETLKMYQALALLGW